MLFLLIPIGWLVIMTVFLAVCHTAASGDAGRPMQAGPVRGLEDAARVRRWGARLRGVRVRAGGSAMHAPHARSEALTMSGGERQP